MKKIKLCLLASIITVLAFAQNKPYKGAEIFTKQQYKYGKMEVRMRAAKASGIISNFFTYKNGSEKGDTFWEEIDIEIFGKNGAASWQSNMVTGQGNSNLTRKEGVHGQRGLGDSYHTYTIEWSPGKIVWKVDGRLIRTQNGGQANDIKNAASLRFNIWNPNIPSWVGPFNANDLSKYMYVNWIKYYRWNGNGFAGSPTWTDNFNSFNGTRWAKAQHTFGENLADFVPANAGVKNGYLILALTRAGQTGLGPNPPVDGASGGGGGNPNPAPAPVANNAPIGRQIAIQKTGGDFRWVTAEKFGNNQLIARAAKVQGWERFTVEAHPSGGFALKAQSNNKYVQVFGTDANKPVAAKGNAKQGWERLQWKGMGAGKCAIKSLWSNRWLQADHRANNAVLYPRGGGASTWETFNFIFIDGKKEIGQADATDAVPGSITPNPYSGGSLSLNFNSNEENASSNVKIYAIDGGIVGSANTGSVQKGNISVDITNAINNLAMGMYIVEFTAGKNHIIKKLQVL